MPWRRDRLSTPVFLGFPGGSDRKESACKAWVYLSLSPLLLASLLFSAICKASPDNHFAFLHFLFLGMVLVTAAYTVYITTSLDGKESACNAGDPGPGRSPGEENGYPLHYSCPENTMDRGAWLAIVLRVAKSQT